MKLMDLSGISEASLKEKKIRPQMCVAELRLSDLALKLDQISIKRIITGHPRNTGHRCSTGCSLAVHDTEKTLKSNLGDTSQSKSSQYLGHTGKE